MTGIRLAFGLGAATITAAATGLASRHASREAWNGSPGAIAVPAVGLLAGGVGLLQSVRAGRGGVSTALLFGASAGAIAGSLIGAVAGTTAEHGPTLGEYGLEQVEINGDTRLEVGKADMKFNNDHTLVLDDEIEPDDLAARDPSMMEASYDTLEDAIDEARWIDGPSIAVVRGEDSRYHLHRVQLHRNGQLQDYHMGEIQQRDRSPLGGNFGERDPKFASDSVAAFVNDRHVVRNPAAD